MFLEGLQREKNETQCTLMPMLISDMTCKKPPGSPPPKNKTPYKDLRIAGRVGEVLH